MLARRSEYNSSMNAVSAAAIADLRRTIGREWVLTDPGDLLAYGYDGTIERGAPQVVCLPASAEEVAATVRIAQRYDLPVIPRGAGTGLSGGAVAAFGGVIVGMSRLN